MRIKIVRVKVQYSLLTSEQIAYGDALKSRHPVAIAGKMTDSHFNLIPGSTCSHWGKIGGIKSGKVRAGKAAAKKLAAIAASPIPQAVVQSAPKKKEETGLLFPEDSKKVLRDPTDE